MTWLLAIVAPLSVTAFARHGLSCGWLLWLVTLPALIALGRRRGAGQALAAGLLGALPLVWYDTVDALRFVAQIAVPAAVAAWVGRRTPLRARDGWWLAVAAAGLSTLLGALVGRGANLADVLLPAGLPTGWVEIVVARWAGFVDAWAPEPFVVARVHAFAALVEPTLWFGLLVPLMGAAAVLSAGDEAPATGATAGAWRERERDVALFVLCFGMGTALWGRGLLASIGANVAVIAFVFFVLQGIELVELGFRRLRVRRVVALLGWAMLVSEPAAIFALHVLGVGDLWLGLHHGLGTAKG